MAQYRVTYWNNSTEVLEAPNIATAQKNAATAYRFPVKKIVALTTSEFIDGDGDTDDEIDPPGEGEEAAE